MKIKQYINRKSINSVIRACYGDIVTVNPIINGGSGNYTYIWSDSSDDTSFDYSFELSQGSSQVVNLEVVDDCTNESFPFSVDINLEDQTIY